MRSAWSRHCGSSLAWRNGHNLRLLIPPLDLLNMGYPCPLILHPRLPQVPPPPARPQATDAGLARSASRTRMPGKRSSCWAQISQIFADVDASRQEEGQQDDGLDAGFDATGRRSGDVGLGQLQESRPRHGVPPFRARRQSTKWCRSALASALRLPWAISTMARRRDHR